MILLLQIKYLKNLIFLDVKNENDNHSNQPFIVTCVLKEM